MVRAKDWKLLFFCFWYIADLQIRQSSRKTAHKKGLLCSGSTTFNSGVILPVRFHKVFFWGGNWPTHYIFAHEVVLRLRLKLFTKHQHYDTNLSKFLICREAHQPSFSPPIASPESQIFFATLFEYHLCLSNA